MDGTGVPQALPSLISPHGGKLIELLLVIPQHVLAATSEFRRDINRTKPRMDHPWTGYIPLADWL
jgi:hypothetical protein